MRNRFVFGALPDRDAVFLRNLNFVFVYCCKKHEGALKELGLVDDHDKPTWFTDGKPDLLKMLDIGGANAPKIPVERRAAIERALFGAQGGGFALLADPARDFDSRFRIRK